MQPAPHLLDGEVLSLGREWLIAFTDFEDAHQFQDEAAVLHDYRHFKTEWQKSHDALPRLLAARPFTTCNGLPVWEGIVGGSWGHYCLHWISVLRNLDREESLLNTAALCREVGFFPAHYEVEV